MKHSLILGFLAGMITSLNYDVHIGEEKVFRAKINSKTEVKIYDEGTSCLGW